MPLLTNSPRNVGVAGRALRAALTTTASLLLITCTDNPSAPGGAGMGQIRVYPTFDASARMVPLALDNIRILVIRPPNDTIKTVTQSFPANQNQIQVTAAQIPLQSTSEDLIVVIELYSGTTLLFSGTDTVAVQAGVTPAAAAVPVTYAGPGSNVDSLQVSPRDTTVPPGAVVPFSVQGFAAGSSLPEFYVSWSATAGTIDPLGSYTAPVVPGTYFVHAASPTATSAVIKDSTTITVAILVPGRTWTGAVSTDWHTAGNWSPAQVPGLADDVTIPVTSVQPVVSTTANMNDLTINAGASVTLATTFTFNVAGNLSANGNLLVSGGTPTIQLSGTGKTLLGQVANASITGTIALAGNTTVSGNVTISGGAATLNVGIALLQVGGNFSTGSGGRLIMTTAGGQLAIQGSAAFGGGDENGALTAGTITIAGNFSQTGSGNAASFAASGSHTTGFIGATASHTVNFGTPGAGTTSSHFNTLDISNTATLSLATDAFANGLFLSTPSQAAPTLGTTGATHRLTAAGVSVTGLSVNQATFAIGAGAIVAFNGVQFSNSPTTAAQLTVNNPGAATAFTFTGLNFATTPVGPNGFYMDVTDTDGATSGVLTINMPAVVPTTPGLFLRTAGGAIVNWPVTTPVLTWDGSADNSWSNAANWTPAQVPTNADDVLIPSGTPNTPQLSSSCSAKSLTVNAGASLSTNTVNCQVGGNVFADGAITGTGAIQIATAAQIRGTISFLQLSGAVTAVGPLTVTGSMTVTGTAGRFAVNGQVVTVATTFTVQSGARLIMTNVSDQLTVFGNALFAGGFELDSMSAGTLTIGGNLTQVGTGSGDSFHPSGLHQTIFTGAAPTITFGTPGDVPGSSHFQGFSWTGTGTLTLASDVYSHGVFTTTSTAGITVSSAAGRLLQIGSHAASGPITFSNVRLGLSQPTGGPLALGNATFQGLANTAVQLSVSHPGTGGPFTFNNLSFSVTPTGAGRFISATDADGATPTPLTINVTNSTPTSPGGFVTVTNGAVVNWPPVAPAPTWLGTVSTDWNVAGNWSSGVVPSPTDSVVIPIVGNQPTLTANAFVGAVNITGGTLTLNGRILTVARTFATTGAGTVTMTNLVDSLRVSGNASFGGGNETNLLSAGIITIAGNLNQAGNAGSFAATGTHGTIFTGSPTITFANPGSGPGFSHFQELGLLRPSALILASDVVVEGSPHGFGIGTLSLIGSGQSLTLRGNGGGGGGGPDSGAVVFNNVRLIIDQVSSTIDTLDDFVFQGLPSTATQLTIRHPGGATPVGLRNVTFNTLPTTGGFYISATDVNTSDGVPLVVDVINGSPTSGGAFTQTAGGATINWPAATPVRTWAGTSSNDWFTASNWVGGTAPATTDNVVIPSGTPFVATINNSTSVNDLTVQPGANLSLGDVSLNVTGNLDASGSVAGCCGDFIALSGSTVRGNFDQVVLSVSPGEVVTLNGATTLTNSTVQLAGELILNGNTLNVGQGTVSTMNGTGLLTMTNPADQVFTGFIDFSGGDEAGRLTAGVIHTQSLNQGGTVSTSFLTGGNHKVILGGPSTSSVSFANPGNSRFQELDVTGVSATLTLGSNVTVAGQLISTPSAANGPVITGSGVTLTAGGADVGVLSGFTALTFNGVPLVLSGGTISGFDRVSFQNQSPVGTALTVNNNGAGGPFTIDLLTFTTQLTAGGFHLVANDLDGPTANGPLTINVTNSTPASGAGVSQANNGAVINWVAGTPIWDGSQGNSDWNDPLNWSTNLVPGAADSVVIPNVGNQPVLTSAVTVGAVNISGGNITINRNTLTVARTFATTGIGTLTMNLVNDRVDIGGDAIFAGGGGGALDSGTVTIGGNFSQLNTNSPASYAATCGHQTQFINPAPTISFATPGPSHFGTLLGTFGQTFTLGSSVTVECLINGGDGFGGIIKGGGTTTLTAQQIFSGGMTLDGVQLVMNDPTGIGFGLGNIDFVNQPNTAVQLTISHPGFVQGTAYSLSSINWAPLTGSDPGFYVSAVDPDGGSLAALIVDIFGNNPGNGPAFTKTDGTATVIWQGAPIQWSGGSDNDSWLDSGNWVGGVVPTASDNVLIPAGTPFDPRVTGGTSPIKDLHVLSGATLLINDATLTVNGSVISDGTITNPGSGNLSLDGAGQSIQGNVGNISVASTGGYSLSGLTTADNVDISGVLSPNGNLLFVNVNLSTNGLGTLAMTNAGDQVHVTGNATFSGGTTTGLLTEGILTVGGTFTQTGISSFSASGNHTVALSGATLQNVSVPNGQFANLVVATPGGMMAQSDLFLTGALSTGAGPINLNGHRTIVGADFTTSGAGTLVMQNPNGFDSLFVTGTAVFAGGSTDGLMVNGVLRVGLGLTQLNVGGSNTSFAPSVLHKTQVGATGTISFQTPGSGAAGSHFMNLDITGANGGLSVPSGGYVDGALIATAGAKISAPGSGAPLIAKQWQVTGLIVDNVDMKLDEGGVAQLQTFNNVTFQGFPTAPTGRTLIDVTAVGGAAAARTITFNGTLLQTTLGTGGLYVRVASSNPFGLNLVMAGSNDPTGGFSRSQATPPATIQYQ